MMQYGVVGGVGSYIDQMYQEYTEYQQVWDDIKQEMPIEAKAMEQAKETYFIGSSTTLEIYTSDCKQLYPATRSTTQIEGLPDINKGYEDINITLSGITFGFMHYRQGDHFALYPYIGLAGGKASISWTGSQDEVNFGASFALQANLIVGGQYGVSFDSGSGGPFLEYGFSFPWGIAGVTYATFGPINWDIR